MGLFGAFMKNDLRDLHFFFQREDDCFRSFLNSELLVSVELLKKVDSNKEV